MLHLHSSVGLSHLRPPSLQEFSPTNCRTSRAATSKECPQNSRGTSSHNISQKYWEIAHRAVPEHQRQHLTQQNAQQEHQHQHREERMAYQHRREHWKEHQQAQRWTTPRRTSYWRRKEEAQHQEDEQPPPQQQQQQQQQHRQDGSWQEHCHQEARWNQHQEWHGWQHRQQQPHHQDWNDDLAWYRPIGAGHEWDDYIRHRQQQARRTSARTWARQQDGGHRTKIYLNIFHLQATWHIAIWSSSSTKMSAIILPQDPRVHHDLLPDILSHTITHILNLGLPRVELRSHLASALHAVPPGVTHQSQNNIKVTLRLLDRQLAPRRHHRELIDHLRHHLESLQAHQGECNIRDSLTTSCQHYLQQLPSRQDDRVADHRNLGRFIVVIFVYIEQWPSTSPTTSAHRNDYTWKGSSRRRRREWTSKRTTIPW